MPLAYFRHTPVGKSTQAAPYTAAANWNYISRPNATEKVIHGNLPMAYHREAVKRWLTDMEDTIRKNGRVCDKFIIPLPKEMTAEQAEHLLTSFMKEVSYGKAPWLATLQDWGTNNPHAHVIFVDRDDEGKRVFGTSKKGSTERLKAIWENTHNAHMEAHGINMFIQFGPKQELPEPTHEPYFDDPLRPVIPVDEEDDISDSEPPAEEAALDKIRFALNYHRELHTLRTARQTLYDLQLLSEEARERLQQATALATAKANQALEAEYQAEDATTRYQGYLRPDGSHKGFELKLFGKSLITSPKRKAALEALDDKERAEYTAQQAKLQAISAEEAKRAQEQAIKVYDDQMARLDQFTRAYGEPEDLDTAEAVMEKQRAQALEGLSLNDIQELYQNGELNEEEYLDTLRVMGYGEIADEYEQGQQIE